MFAKRVLKSICEEAIALPKPCRVTRRVGQAQITLQMQSFTEGEWTISHRGESFTTTHIAEAEIMLDEVLRQKAGAA